MSTFRRRRYALIRAPILATLLVIGLVAAASADTDLTTPQCLGCHPEIEAYYASYSGGGWWVTTWHPDVDCATSGCHWPGGPYPEEGWWWNGWISPWSIADHQYDACEFCHSPQFPAVAQHTSASIAASHTKTNQLCRGCHSESLVVEHSGCLVCHASTDPRVRAAISAGDISCSACHTYTKGHGAGTKSGSGR